MYHKCITGPLRGQVGRRFNKGIQQGDRDIYHRQLGGPGKWPQPSLLVLARVVLSEAFDDEGEGDDEVEGFVLRAENRSSCAAG